MGDEGFWGGVLDAVSTIVAPVVQKVASAVDTALGWVNTTVGTYIWDTDDDAGYVESWVKDGVISTTNLLNNAVDGLFDTVTGAISGYVQPAIDWGYDLYDWINDTVTTSVGVAVDKVTDVTEAVTDIVTNPETGLVKSAGEKVDIVEEYLRQPDVVREFIIEKTRELSFDPLGGVLLGLIDNVGLRIEIWLANALGLAAKSEPTDEEEE